jgi:hypothetical protein
MKKAKNPVEIKLAGPAEAYPNIELTHPVPAPKLKQASINEFLLNFVQEVLKIENINLDQFDKSSASIINLIKTFDNTQILGFQKQIGLSANNGEFKIEVVFSKKHK